MNDDEGVETPEAVPVPVDSPLARLRAQHERLRDEVSSIHVRVPRTSDPEIWIAYDAVEPDDISAALDKRRKQAKNSKKAKGEAVVNANADVLVSACQGIYWLDDEGKEHGLNPSYEDDWPKFDHRLADALGVTTSSAVETCKALFATHADLVSHATQLVQLSGISADDLQERFEGE